MRSIEEATGPATEDAIGLRLGGAVEVHAPKPGPGHDHHGKIGTLAAKLDQPVGTREWWVRLHGNNAMGGGGFAWLPRSVLLPIRGPRRFGSGS